MSNTELSREIAHLVTRAVGGEAIDPAAAGDSLARRFPHLSLPGEMIGKAIARAASMVGVELTGSAAAIAPPVYRASDTAYWYVHFAPNAGSGSAGEPDIAASGWFAPPKAGAAPVAGPEQILLGDGNGAGWGSGALPTSEASSISAG